MDLLKIVQRSLKGEKKAFQVLFELFYKEAYHSAYLITRNREQAEDAAQEAFLKAFKRLDTLQEPKKFGAWIRSIAARSALDILRREKHLLSTDEPEHLGHDLPLFSSGFPLPELEAERSELRSRVREVIASLKPAHQHVLVLKFFHDLDDPEIAKLLDIPVGTVKSRTHRALQLVERMLIPHMEETRTQLALSNDTAQQERGESS